MFQRSMDHDKSILWVKVVHILDETSQRCFLQHKGHHGSCQENGGYVHIMVYFSQSDNVKNEDNERMNQVDAEREGRPSV